MDYIINGYELDALCGLLHFHQLTYLRGIRPYMDVQTGMVGIKRGISYQSIAEQLYVEPHQGIQSSNYSRAQIRRAISALEKAALIHIQSEKLKLILKCPLATLGYFVQNKPVTKPSQEAVTFNNEHPSENKGFFGDLTNKADIGKTAKAVTPLNSNNNYIFLLKHFERFWALYPVKISEAKAWQVFQGLNPSEELAAQMLNALQNQLNYVHKQLSLGCWVPNWKNPANWLAQRCWNDEIPTEQLTQENQNAKHKVSYRKQQATDPLWNLCKPDSKEPETFCGNVIELSKWGR